MIHGFHKLNLPVHVNRHLLVKLWSDVGASVIEQRNKKFAKHVIPVMQRYFIALNVTINRFYGTKALYMGLCLWYMYIHVRVSKGTDT